MSITKIFLIWLIVSGVFFGLGALINGANVLELIVGYSIMTVIVAFLCTLIHFGVQQFLKKDSITPSLHAQHPDTHNTTNAPKIMSDRISQIVNNLLDEAVIAASRSDWREVIRLCEEADNLDRGNADAARMIEAAETNLKPPELESKPDTAVISSPTLSSKDELRNDYINLSSRQGWAKFTVGATVVALVASILATISEINLISFIENFNNLSGMERWELTGSTQLSNANTEVLARIGRNDGLQMGVSFVSLAAYLVSVVSFLAWLQATSRNLSLVRGTPARFSPGWVIGWWFIPFANLFKPYQVMKDVWAGSVNATDNGERTSERVWPWLGWFWGAHLTGNLISWWSLRTASEDLQSILAGDYIALVGNLITVAAGVILFVFIVKITDGQEDWHANASQINTTPSTLQSVQ